MTGTSGAGFRLFARAQSSPFRCRLFYCGVIRDNNTHARRRTDAIRNRRVIYYVVTRVLRVPAARGLARLLGLAVESHTPRARSTISKLACCRHYYDNNLCSCAESATDWPVIRSGSRRGRWVGYNNDDVLAHCCKHRHRARRGRYARCRDFILFRI